MTLNQLKYAVTVAECSSMTEAARRLFITQPSLTASIHELEREMKITIFSRTNKGVTVTPEGEEFLGYARQMLEQEAVMLERYTGRNPGKEKFCVSGQHYAFVVEAFVDLMKQYGGDEYEFHLRETQTWQILEDVARGRSSVGVLYMNDFNRTILTRAIDEHGLVFTRLFRARPHVFVSRVNPLAQKSSVTMEDLDAYPRLSYEQGEHNSFYYAEEIQSTVARKKDIVVTDCSGSMWRRGGSSRIISRGSRRTQRRRLTIETLGLKKKCRDEGLPSDTSSPTTGQLRFIQEKLR